MSTFFRPMSLRRTKKAPRTDKKQPGKHILSGKWKGYTPPPMPKKSSGKKTLLTWIYQFESVVC